jgi:D5 N terminal like
MAFKEWDYSMNLQNPALRLIMAGREPEIGDPFTEDALALRFSERHKDDLRYLAPKAQWFHWDGIRWRPEDTLLAYDLARESCRLDAAEFGNGKPPKCAFDAGTFAAVEKLAKADRRHATTLACNGMPIRGSLRLRMRPMIFAPG